MPDKGLRFSKRIDWHKQAGECNLAVQRLKQLPLFIRRRERNVTYGR